MVEVASDYFHTLFHARVGDQMKEYLNVVHTRVTKDMKLVLSSGFTADEVRVALFQMGPTKALGPDSMNVLFYQKF